LSGNRLPKLNYFAPASFGEALELKHSLGKDAAILAGGTDILPLLKRRNIAPGHIISLKKIPDFHKIVYHDREGLRIGAAVTLRDLTQNHLISGRYPILAQAGTAVAYNQIRNMGTLVGNVCLDNKCSFFNQSAFWWRSRADCFKRGGDRCYIIPRGKRCYALSAGDTVAALVAHDAMLEIRNAEQEREMPLLDFYSGDGRCPHHLGENEVVTAVRIPPPVPGWHEAFMKKSTRGSVDFAMATMALRLRTKGAGVEDARIALNSVSTKPIRAKETEKYLTENGMNNGNREEVVRRLLNEITPLSAVGVSVFLRRRIIEAMASDLLEKALEP
jgi:4-hydroxybenzoyl-CoA reductase subunit beta